MTAKPSAPNVDDSRVLWSVPAQERSAALTTRPLLVMLHGYGSNAADLFGLVTYVPEEFVVASVEGLEPAGSGWAWFALGVDPETGALTREPDRVAAAARSILAWTDALREANPAISGIHLLGFSQGGAMALEILRRRPADVVSVAVLAGFALPADDPDVRSADATLARVRPPVFWGRDPQDPVISPDMISFTQAWLTEHTEVQAHEYSGVGHGISLEELADLRAFWATRA